VVPDGQRGTTADVAPRCWCRRPWPAPRRPCPGVPPPSRGEPAVDDRAGDRRRAAAETAAIRSCQTVGSGKCADVQQSTSRPIRSGCSAARDIPTMAPSDSPHQSTRSTPRSSSSARTSSARSADAVPAWPGRGAAVAAQVDPHHPEPADERRKLRPPHLHGAAQRADQDEHRPVGGTVDDVVRRHRRAAPTGLHRAQGGQLPLRGRGRLAELVGDLQGPPGLGPHLLHRDPGCSAVSISSWTPARAPARRDR
jgi:hypothetical protein